jgi:hypothetical protein
LIQFLLPPVYLALLTAGFRCKLLALLLELFALAVDLAPGLIQFLLAPVKLLAIAFQRGMLLLERSRRLLALGLKVGFPLLERFLPLAQRFLGRDLLLFLFESPLLGLLVGLALDHPFQLHGPQIDLVAGAQRRITEGTSIESRIMGPTSNHLRMRTGHDQAVRRLNVTGQ